MRKISLTKDDIESFFDKGIQLTVSKNPIAMQQRATRPFLYPDSCLVGSRIGFWRSFIFSMQIGAYSYSFSALESYFSIGNYCSIASGLKIMGYRHPMERFTTSSITYDTGLTLFNRPDFKIKKTSAPPRGIMK